MRIIFNNRERKREQNKEALQNEIKKKNEVEKNRRMVWDFFP
jgi:hypothetical protein